MAGQLDFGGDNRAIVNGSLHCIIVGLTLRVGRLVARNATMMLYGMDLSVLFRESCSRTGVIRPARPAWVAERYPVSLALCAARSR